MKSSLIFNTLSALVPVALACGGSEDSCYGPINRIEHVRHVKRIQPGAAEASYNPKGPLSWGQVNFLHTTDTHGWLSGHIKEQNYGADWGDFVTFAHRMKQTARDMGVDLLLIDTGDLHDGTGLSDATEVDGEKSMPIWEAIDYDLMAIGNHELYVADISYQMFDEYATKWGDRYVTSNVKVFNQASGQYEYVGATHRYFTTEQGLRIMAFGVIFDFEGNSNASQIIKAADLVKEEWFIDTLHTDDPIDMFILLGHNPVRQTDPVSTFQTVWDAIREVHPTTPIEIFGGHTHVRDFAVYDDSSVALESGRYCETLGWMSMSGFNSANSAYEGAENPDKVPNPERKATEDSTGPFTFSRRYLDWNRNTFIYHSKVEDDEFDQEAGLSVTEKITDTRKELRLGEVYGCAPKSYCLSCAPIGDPDSIYSGFAAPATAAIVVDEKRANRSRLIYGNTNGLRFDLYKGPFTNDDKFIISPLENKFNYLPDVPYEKAKKLLNDLNPPAAPKRDLAYMPATRDECIDPIVGMMGKHETRETHGIFRRQESVTDGYVTSDDWGYDGDDSEHSEIPHYDVPKHWEARANFPKDGSDPETVDVIFYEYIQKRILGSLGKEYTASMASCYASCEFNSRDVLELYARKFWQENVDDCPIE